MGYKTHYKGEIEFDKSPSMVDGNHITDKILEYYRTSWSEDCQILKIGDGEPIKLYDWIDNFKELLFFCKEKGYSISGQINCEGEEAGDIWAFKVENGNLYEAKTKVVFQEFKEV